MCNEVVHPLNPPPAGENNSNASKTSQVEPSRRAATCQDVAHYVIIAGSLSCTTTLCQSDLPPVMLNLFQHLSASMSIFQIFNLSLKGKKVIKSA